jgi:DinB superfamily
MAVNQIDVILDLIDQAFDHAAWHGTNLKGSLRGLRIEEVIWRPAPGKHNIWELMLHAAYWKYIVRRRLLNEKKGSFPLAGSNFFARPVEGYSDKKAWDKDVKLLVETHRSLRAAVANLDPRSLTETASGSKYSILQTVNGIAAHDCYHTGQIQLIKRLYETQNK